MSVRTFTPLVLLILLLAEPAHALFKQFSPVYRYTDLGNGEVSMQVGTILLDGSFVAPSSSVAIPSTEFAPGVLAAVNGKIVTAEVVYDGFKGVISRKFRRSAQTYAISGAPWVVISVSGAKPPKPTVTIAATDSSASETALDPGEFKIMLDAPTSVDITVRFAIGGAAKRGRDYSSIKNTVKIPAGNTSGLVEIAALDDDRREPTETVKLTLQAGVGYKLGVASLRRASVDIADND